MLWSEWQNELLEILNQPTTHSHPGLGVDTTQHAIYQDYYLACLEEILQEAYPIIRQLVGKSFFYKTIRHFTETHRPLQEHLHHYAAQFSRFLQTQASAHALPYLADMAKVEWAVYTLRYLPDNASFNEEKCQQFAAEGWKVLNTENVPIILTLRSPWPIASLWLQQQCIPGKYLAPLEDEPEYILVYRTDNQVRVESASMGISHLLKTLVLYSTLKNRNANSLSV